MSRLLRVALADAASLNAIAKATGIQRASLYRFRDGRTSLRLDVADTLAAYFGIECRPPRWLAEACKPIPLETVAAELGVKLPKRATRRRKG